jgi:2'-5' RNA ligase
MSQSKTTSNFNIALFADSDDLISSCTGLARDNLASQADGYLLGEDAWPHVTLCQFSLDPKDVASIWSAVELLARQPILLSFHHLYMMPGVQEHTNKTWLGLAVTPSAEILKLQKSIYEKLHDLKIQSTTPPDSYFPHLTWGRIDASQGASIAHFPPQNIWRDRHSFSLSLGRSDVNGIGIYHERLYPLPLKSINKSKEPTFR